MSRRLHGVENLKPFNEVNMTEMETLQKLHEAGWSFKLQSSMGWDEPYIRVYVFVPGKNGKRWNERFYDFPTFKDSFNFIVSEYELRKKEFPEKFA